ncbi:uncharacterized protein LMH87_007641 [Akanthomyces muscarius]|uniref:Allergen Asp f 4 n=1 Tax=Akanthomyces muscarius TaxID=2231603 RepID=A0A9W8QKM1_AKAMU|nr:uncharacterized protein LMH87_007641 [Akanthomyces muscarius]KAJ4161611.1 hypothetical protein LMH87_007641 [Akanthomyces muscarius]
MKSSVMILLASGACSFASQSSVEVEQPISSIARSSAYIPFCGGQKRSTAADIAYVGNTGAKYHYGCNIMQIPADIASKYKYTINFINEGYAIQQCKCWNKAGPDNGTNGFFTGNEAITFSLAASGQQFIAFDENSLIGCSCHAGSIPLTPQGQFASTWVEAEFGNEANGKCSGFDASSLVPAFYDMDIPGLSVCGPPENTCSTIHPGGAGENAYVKGMAGLNIVPPIDPGPVALTVKVDIK